MSQKYSSEETFSRIKNWCDRQERCHQEVKTKLATWGVYYSDSDEILAALIEGNYLNEERFAKAYVSGKFRIKKWGKVKIKQNLKQKNISKYCIQEGLTEIENDEYLETLNYLIERKINDWSEQSSFVLRGKIANFLIRKGYESELVWRELMGLIK